MAQEIIAVLTFILTFCITFSVFRIRRYKKEIERYEKTLETIRRLPPKVIKETVPLSVIETRQYVPAEQYLRVPTDYIEKSMEQLLEVQIGEKIVEACGVQKGYDVQTDTYCFRVAVEVTGRSFKKEGENES